MEYYEVIQQRESIRNYDPDKPVPVTILKRILDAGRMAPSACNIQPWRFLVISSPEMLQKVRKCYQRDWFRDAPHILVVTGSKDTAWQRYLDGYNSIETDLAIAMTHIILAAENEGVATCWIEAYDPALLKEAVNLPGNQVIFGITPLGYPKPGFKKTQKKIRKNPDEVNDFI